MSDTEDQLKDRYKKHSIQQFRQLVERRLHPIYEGVSSPLFYGSDFPFGTYRVIPEISKYSLFLDIQMLLLSSTGNFRHPDYANEKKSNFHIALKATTCRWKLEISAVAQGIEDYDEVQIFERFHEGLRAPQRSPTQISDQLNETAIKFLSIPAGSQQSAESSDIVKEG